MVAVNIAMPASGVIGFHDLQRVFGATHLGALYRGGANVPGSAQNANVSIAGAISLAQFYGAGRNVTVDDQVDDLQTNYSTDPGQVLTSYWAARVVEVAWRVRFNYTGLAYLSGPNQPALSTWIDRTAGQSRFFQISTTNGSFGGSSRTEGNVTIDYALAGQTTPFYTHVLYYQHEIGAPP